MSKNAITDLITRQIERRTALSESDKSAIRALPFVARDVAPTSYLVREGERPTRCAFLISGYCFRHKLTADGARQLVSLHVPGDFLDLQNLFLLESDHNIQTLTRSSVAEIDAAALREVVRSHPTIASAFWVEALIEASIFREWIVNVGRRGAHARVGHLLCEFAMRLEAAGAAPDRVFELPVTQEQLGDAVGLTPVHVNRVLKALAERGFIRRDRRQIGIIDWPGLSVASDFNPRYLHLAQT